MAAATAQGWSAGRQKPAFVFGAVLGGRSIPAGSFEIAGTTLSYFVMELIPGARSITQYVADALFSQREILTLFREVCAVGHGHEQGFVHRDFKPGNILVDQHGHPKVIDFGVARASKAARPMTALTDTGQLIGTLQYMSPEQMLAVTDGVDSRAGPKTRRGSVSRSARPVDGLPNEQAESAQPPSWWPEQLQP